MKSSTPKLDRRTGTYVQLEHASGSYRAFVPVRLPPDPPLALRSEDHGLVEQASRALGRLDGLTSLLPDTSLFVYAYVRKEAVFSSQIEGTQSSLADLLLFESDQAPGVPLHDVREVSDYVAAMQHGLSRIRGGDPLSLELIREIHGLLLRGGRGNEKSPGQLRDRQVWIGGSRPANAKFVPPPADHVEACMADLVAFSNDEPEKTPTLVKAGLAHAQFETIHPFRDGNGRVGRLLITLLLCAEGALTAPILYLSLHFKIRRLEYYERLQRVRTHGDWEGWMRFFLEGVVDTADEALGTTRRILALFEADRRKIAGMGRAVASALRVHEALQRKPITTLRELASTLRLSYPTTASAIERMRALGIVDELTGHTRNRVFAYAPYVELLSEGSEPL